MAGAEECRGVLEAAQLSDLAVRLRKYFATVVAAYSFFFYGTAAASYWLAVVALSFLFETGDDPRFWVSALLAMIPLLVLAGFSSGAARPKVSPKTWQRKGRLVSPIFAVIFASAFLVTSAFSPALYSVAWYPALAAALILIHLFIEREAYSRGEVAARPFLVSGVSALVTSPLAVYAALSHPGAGWMLALSLMLATYSVAAFVALKGAARALEAGGERESGEVRGPPEGG